MTSQGGGSLLTGVCGAARGRRAGTEEIRKAIESLEQADLVRIDRFARNRMQRIGRLAAHGREAGDLVHEAVARALEGQRGWRPQRVGFMAFLLGCMRSISSAWAAKYERGRHAREHASSLDSGASPGSSDDGWVPGEPRGMGGGDPETQVLLAEESRGCVARLERALEGDEEAWCILTMLAEGWKYQEIRLELGWSERRFRAAMRRLQRKAAGIT